MSSTPFVINNHPYHDTSSSSSCSSFDISQDEYMLLNNKSSRKKCNSISDDKKKDPISSSQRSRNNLSAKRSRVKRRMNDLVLETKLTQLINENEILRAKIDMLTRKFGEEKSIEQQPTVLNILNQSSIQINSSEQLSLNKSSIPIKLRFKLLNLTSDS
jgi:vrille protein